MWIYVPGTTSSRSVVESQDLISVSNWRFRWLERFATSREKYSAAPTWYRRWKKESWMKLLCGRMSGLSTANRGMVWWMGFMEDTHVSPSQSLERGEGRRTQGISGPTSQESSERSDLSGASSRTSETIYDSDLSKCGMTFKGWVTQLGRDCLARRKLGQAIGGNGCSSWPTTRVSKGNGPSRRDIQLGNPKKKIETEAVIWMTPTKRDHKDGDCREVNVRVNSLLGRQVLMEDGQQSSKSGPNLPQLWRTPNSHLIEAKPEGTKLAGRKPTDPQVGIADQAMNWPTPAANDDNKTPEAHLRMKKRMGERDGTNANRTAITSLQVKVQVGSKGKKLNPLFVEWLMGLPFGWTAFEPVETQSYPLWLQKHSSLFQEIAKL